MNRRLLHNRPTVNLAFRTMALAAAIACFANGGRAPGAISWDGGGMSNWWFDPVNWSYNTNDNQTLPVASPATSGDAQINVGSSPSWDLTGEGVVFDPDNDPFYDDAATNPNYAPGFDRDKIYRLYISRNTPNSNTMTIKSGTLTAMDDPTAGGGATIIIGRSGSTATAQNLGRLIQTGGTFEIPNRTLDVGQRESSGWGNGIYDYRGGALLVQQTAGTQGIRLSAGSSGNGTGGVGKFIMHNPTTGGRVKTFDFTLCSDGTNGDGVLTGVGIAEFHFANGGTRPIQIDRNLTINNGLDADGTGIRSARLDLKLDVAPMLTDGVPQNLGLFDVDFGSIGLNGIINGTGDADGNGTPSEDTDQVFWDVAGSTLLGEGATVSAIFGSTKYNWSITYTGDIQWSDAANSVVSSITGPLTGRDVVLMGLSSETVQVDNADFNGDGEIDGRDFLIWQRGVGVGTTLGQGDANGSNSVDGADLAIWKNQFGQAVAVVGAVPEPGTAALMTLGLASIAIARRRRS